MYSLRYGTVPVVHAVGGLYDTVRDFNPRTGEGNGFSFDNYSAQALLDTLRWALEIYRDRKTWLGIQQRGMRQDFSWDASAGQYVKVYERAVRREPWGSRGGGARYGSPGGQRHMASDKVKTFTDSNFDEEVKTGVVLIDFWAEWCGPCRRLAPTVDALATEYDGRATVAKMNIDENPNIPGRLMIRGLPTILIFKNGELADQIMGLAPKEEIAKKLDQQLVDTVQ